MRKIVVHKAKDKHLPTLGEQVATQTVIVAKRTGLGEYIRLAAIAVILLDGTRNTPRRQ